MKSAFVSCVFERKSNQPTLELNERPNQRLTLRFLLNVLELRLMQLRKVYAMNGRQLGSPCRVCRL